ncbi:MAG: hypothetical protein V7L23_32635 [Nostoc sp.]|uniref:hypothetical protein n=1 Tax=Nostoc sp. TaxID=1180 RepID=UPI002FF065FD
MGIDRQEDAIATKILLAISLVLPFIEKLGLKPRRSGAALINTAFYRISDKM